jgi:hypothetical protein
MVAIHLHVRTMLKEVFGLSARGHLGAVGAPVALKRRYFVLWTIRSLKTVRLRRGRSLGRGRCFSVVSERVSPHCYEDDHHRYEATKCLHRLLPFLTRSNGEVEGPPRSARLEPRVHTVFPHPRSRAILPSFTVPSNDC